MKTIRSLCCVHYLSRDFVISIVFKHIMSRTSHCTSTICRNNWLSDIKCLIIIFYCYEIYVRGRCNDRQINCRNIGCKVCSYFFHGMLKFFVNEKHRTVTRRINLQQNSANSNELIIVRKWLVFLFLKKHEVIIITHYMFKFLYDF